MGFGKPLAIHCKVTEPPSGTFWSDGLTIHVGGTEIDIAFILTVLISMNSSMQLKRKKNSLLMKQNYQRLSTWTIYSTVFPNLCCKKEINCNLKK